MPSPLITFQFPNDHQACVCAVFEEHLVFSGIWVAAKKASNILRCFALNIALTCNYHRINWENKVPGWFMLCIFPKPELNSSKPPKLNHQTESPCFQRRREQRSEVLHMGAVESTAQQGNHPLCSRTTQNLENGGLIIELGSVQPWSCSHLFVVSGNFAPALSTAEICLQELAEAWSLQMGRLHTGAGRMETLLCLETIGGDTVGKQRCLSLPGCSRVDRTKPSAGEKTATIPLGSAMAAHTAAQLTSHQQIFLHL